MLHRVGVVLAPALILISPFLSLVTYDGYPMLAPEILLCGGAILVLGIAIGLLGRAWRPLAAAVLCGSLLLFIDIQFDPSYMALALAAVPLLGLCWALGDNLALVTAAGFAAVVASTLLWAARGPMPNPRQPRQPCRAAVVRPAGIPSPHPGRACRPGGSARRGRWIGRPARADEGPLRGERLPSLRTGVQPLQQDRDVDTPPAERCPGLRAEFGVLSEKGRLRVPDATRPPPRAGEAIRL